MQLNSRERRQLRRRLVRSLSGFLGTESAAAASVHDPGRIAIVRSNHRLGNVLMLTPLVEEIQRLWPSARIDIIAGGRLADVFQNFPAVEHCRTMPKPPLRALLNPSFRRAISGPYDLVINADSESQSGRWLTRLIPARHRLGGARPDAQAQTMASRHMALAPIELLRTAAGLPAGAEYPPLSLNLSPAERELGARALAALLPSTGADGPVIGLYPYGDKNRNYPLEWWQQCLEQLRAQIPGVRLVEILPAHGQALLETVASKLDGRQLRLLCAQMAAMDLVLATDSGMMHLAACSGVTTFGLFRVTDPAVYAPYGGHNRGWTEDAAEPGQLARAALVALSAAKPGAALPPTACADTAPAALPELPAVPD